jgi:eukaryotic-like serine/threonine-protein kinase
MKQDLLDLISRSTTLPTMPQVVVRFLEISADERCDIQQLITVLKTDPGICGELLRMTNSALFGVTRKVSSLQQAVALLGISRVRTLVLGRYMVDRLDTSAGQLEGLSFSYYWRRALAGAVLATRFADHLAPKQREEAFIGALLCDTGVVAMLQAIGKVYSQIVVDYAPLHGHDYVEHERTALGLTHADVSAMVLEKWMLPPTVVQAVRCHHNDDLTDLADENARNLAAILNASGRLGRILCEKPEKTAITEACTAAMQVLRIDATSLQQALQDVEPMIRDFADLLRIYIVRSNIFNRINDIIAQELTGTSQPATA